MRKPRKRAGYHHCVEGVMAQVAAILLRELTLLGFSEFVPSLPQRQWVEDLIQPPGLSQSAGELAVGDLKTPCGLLRVLQSSCVTPFSFFKLKPKVLPEATCGCGL